MTAREMNLFKDRHKGKLIHFENRDFLNEPQTPSVMGHRVYQSEGKRRYGSQAKTAKRDRYRLPGRTSDNLAI